MYCSLTTGFSGRKVLGIFENQPPGVSRKSRELFGPGAPVVKLQSACFENLIFEHVLNVRKIAKFDGLEPPRFEVSREL